MLSSASLVVQQFAGITTEPILVDPVATAGCSQATSGAGLLVIGLSDRWREEGLGELRAAIAKAAPAPILFVRRGTRPGALAPRTADVTRFSWSYAGPEAVDSYSGPMPQNFGRVKMLMLRRWRDN